MSPIVRIVLVGEPLVLIRNVSSSLNLLVSEPLERCTANVTTLPNDVECMEVSGRDVFVIAFRDINFRIATFRLVSCRRNISVVLCVGRTSNVGHVENILGPVGFALP